MLPFQNIHTGLSGGSGVDTKEEKEGWRGRVGHWRSPPDGLAEGRGKEPPRYTKLALCEISDGHREGPTALFSQSEPVCFLWASVAEPVRRAAGWQAWRLRWGSVVRGGEPGISYRVGQEFRGLPDVCLIFASVC